MLMNRAFWFALIVSVRVYVARFISGIRTFAFDFAMRLNYTRCDAQQILFSSSSANAWKWMLKWVANSSVKCDYCRWQTNSGQIHHCSHTTLAHSIKTLLARIYIRFVTALLVRHFTSILVSLLIDSVLLKSQINSSRQIIKVLLEKNHEIFSRRENKKTHTKMFSSKYLMRKAVHTENRLRDATTLGDITTSY